MHRVPLVTALVIGLAALAGPAHATGNPDAVCIAHRGNPTTHPEETIPTYDDALSAGWTIDGDIRFTSTGYPVMLHDANLGLFGAPTVAIASVTQTVAQSYHSTSGDNVESLNSVKAQMISYPGTLGEFELKVVPTSAEWTIFNTRLGGLKDRVLITSFDVSAVRAAQDQGYRTALLVSTDTSSTAASLVDENAPAITSTHVADLASVGVATEAWWLSTDTTDNTTGWDALYAAGVRRFNTDDNAGCLAWKAGSP
jgi:glycerophosphoryl diester phosphodiesterase